MDFKKRNYDVEKLEIPNSRIYICYFFYKYMSCKLKTCFRVVRNDCKLGKFHWKICDCVRLYLLYLRQSAEGPHSRQKSRGSRSHSHPGPQLPCLWQVSQNKKRSGHPCFASTQPGEKILDYLFKFWNKPFRS